MPAVSACVFPLLYGRNEHVQTALRVFVYLSPLFLLGGVGGSKQQQQQNARRGQLRKRAKLARKASQRKYAQVTAEDMFRPEAKVKRQQQRRLFCT